MATNLTSIQIFKLLPKTDCNDCGLGTCKGFAAKVAAENAELEMCPHLTEKQHL